MRKAWRSSIETKGVADVVAMTVDEAVQFFAEETQVLRALHVLREIGLGIFAWSAGDGAFV